MYKRQSEYNADTDQRTIAIAAIKVLKRMIVLTNDTLGKSSQVYSVEKLEKRIKDPVSYTHLRVYFIIQG